jgi:hypothetical protein
MHVLFMIENYLFISHFNSWVLDTWCGFHICNNVQELKKSIRLFKGEVDLHIGNGVRVVVLVVETYYLTLSSGMILELDNCYFIPLYSRNIDSFLSYLMLFLYNKDNDVYYGYGIVQIIYIYLIYKWPCL